MKKKHRKLSRKGATFIAGFEGFSSKPYKDAVGVWTIGYGHTSRVSSKSRAISTSKGLDYLQKDAAAVAKVVNRLPIKLNQHQFDALVSFGFNLGAGIFGKDHTIGEALHRGDHKAAADAILLYDKAGGRALAGLTRRRQAERKLFKSRIRHRRPH